EVVERVLPYAAGSRVARDPGQFGRPSSGGRRSPTPLGGWLLLLGAILRATAIAPRAAIQPRVRRGWPLRPPMTSGARRCPLAPLDWYYPPSRQVKDGVGTARASRTRGLPGEEW